jgi:hypothetical protein
MGTNYYLHQKPDCGCCGRPCEPLHIGKSSAGWCFSLHVMPDEGINTLDDWRRLWAAHGAYIRDEYDERVSIADMELIITARRCGWGDWNDTEWRPPYYENERDFHDKNQSERGPNGLLRHRIGRYCVSHGNGTWDCIVGEFS